MPESDKHGPIRYLSFYGDTFLELRARMMAAPPDGIFRVHGPFDERATLEVLGADTADAARLKPLNEAHPCPPQC